jgi:ABC-type transport system substrate-binding protein
LIGRLLLRALPGCLACLWLVACGERPWNDPYGADTGARKIYYSVFQQRPKHLDPVSSYSEDEALFTGQVYEPVVQYHFLKRPYELVPLTATAVPAPRYFGKDGNPLPDGAPDDSIAEVVYRITIKPGIRFQPHPALARGADGSYVYHALRPEEIARRHTLADFAETGTRELTAEDYVYEIKRLAHPHLHSPVASFLGRYIEGLDELAQKLAKEQGANRGFVDLRAYELPGARVIDAHTYEIRLKEKYPQFVYWLAMSFFAPVPWEADAFYSQPGMKERNLTLDWYPLGTGPYMLTENNPNRRMILMRNPNYHGETYPDAGEPGDEAQGWLAAHGKPLPFIDEAYFSLEKEDIPEWTKFLQGYYDTAGVSSDSFDQAIRLTPDGQPELTDAMRERDIRLLTSVQPSISYVGFNMLDPVIGGAAPRARLLRQALSIAVDYEEMISIFANGRGEPAQGPIPPGIFGHRDGAAGINPVVYTWDGRRPRRRGIEDARRLLAAAGYPEGRDAKSGEPLVLYFDAIDSGVDTKPLLNWYRKQFAKLGIQLVIRATDYNRFQEKMLKGDAQIYGWGWNADYPDAENFLFLLYGPNGKAKFQGENASNYQNARFDALFLKMRSLPGGPERQAVIDEMLAIVRDDAPWLWGFHPKSYALYHAWYGNAKPNMMARNSLKYRTLDPDLREQQRRAWNTPRVGPVIVVLLVVLASAIPAWFTYRRRQRAGAL